MYWFQRKNPKFVTVNHSRSAEAVKKLGAVPFHESVIAWYDQLSTDTDRMMNIVRAAQIKEWTPLPDSLARNPLIQFELGMEPVDENDTEFWYQSEGVKILMNVSYYPLVNTKKKVQKDLEDLWRQDPESNNIRRMCDAAKIMNSSRISSLWSDADARKRDELVDAVITTLKRFA